MRTNLLKKTGAVLLTAAVAVGSVWSAPKQSKAADTKYVQIFSSGDVSVSAFEKKSYEFNVVGGKQTYTFLYATENVSGSISYYQDGESLGNVTINSSDWVYSDVAKCYCWGYKWTPSADSAYKVEISLNADALYDLEVVHDANQAAISNTKLTITEGFNHKLSVSNAEGSVSWSSSNSKVAAVSSTGLVKAKKNGSATITAKLSDGTKLTCTVSVKKNVYSKSKTPVSSVAYGKTGVDVYKVSYDKKGNLVMKANILNNSYHTDTKIKKLKITIKTLSGKTVATYSIKNKKVNIKAGAKQGFTFTVKKKNVKIKKADLRNIYAPKTTGTIEYKRF
jgi:SLAP domain-containing protein